MKNTSTPFVVIGSPAIRRPDPALLLRQIAFPLVLFAAVLVGLLTLSSLVLLPRLARVEVGGEVRDAHAMTTRLSTLRAELITAEGKRQDLILAIRDPQYLGLKEVRAGHTSLEQVRSQLQEIAASTVSQVDAIHFSGFAYSLQRGTVTVRGDVRFVGSRSMTVLAEFIENLRTSGHFTSVSTPSFVREDGTEGPHSPFTLTLTLP